MTDKCEWTRMWPDIEEDEWWCPKTCPAVQINRHIDVVEFSYCPYCGKPIVIKEKDDGQDNR